MKTSVTELLAAKQDFILFEDDIAVVVCNEGAITEGHLRVFPKREIQTLDQLSSEDSQHLFLVASKCATLLFDGMKCHGTNIIVKDGDSAQAEYDRVCIEAIARFQEDGLDMFWQPKQGDQGAIAQMGKQIQDAITIGGGDVKNTSIQTQKREVVDDSDQIFWEKQFRRIP